MKIFQHSSVGERRTLFTLTAETCRYPYGDPVHDGSSFYFCGLQVRESYVYCSYHQALTRISRKQLNEHDQEYYGAVA